MMLYCASRWLGLGREMVRMLTYDHEVFGLTSGRVAMKWSLLYADW